MNLTDKRFAPTPLYLLDVDAQGNRIFIKRDDLLPYSFGGNKVRIGIAYLRDMQRKECTHMVAYGNARSNLCRVLANLCAGQGVPLTILSPADDDGERRPAFNAQLCTWFGARVVPCLKTEVAQSVDAVLQGIRDEGGKPYYIYGDRLGQGNEAVPTAAYADMADELTAQASALGAHFEHTFLALGTGMTQAGLLCAAHFGHAPLGRIVGISTARDAKNATAHILAYANAHLKAQERELPPEIVHVCDDFRETYGHYGEPVARCIQNAMTRYGLPLDGTYTGKAFYGMTELIQREGLRERDILFLHTGGTPLFFDVLGAAHQ